MLKLQGTHIRLRALEPEDLDFLYQLENDPQVWEISGTNTPYSKHVLRLYLDHAHRDIYDVKQLRLCIANKEDKAVGLIDLFDFDPRNRRAGVGIVVTEPDLRNRGIGTEALQLLCDYAFSSLGLHQVYANVQADNPASIKLFNKLGFREAGRKKDWNLVEGEFSDEILYQKFKD